MKLTKKQIEKQPKINRNVIVIILKFYSIKHKHETMMGEVICKK